MTIAIVMPSLPQYSETFLTNKINGLVESGFKVILMVVGVSEKKDIGLPVYYQPILAPKGLKRWLHTLWLIKKSFLFHPVKSLALLKVAGVEGYRGIGKLRMLAVLSNFLKINVDWIHFAYGTMAVERAFIGKVLNAKVGVSFRGYDIAIAPLTKPSMYDRVWPYITKVHSISKDLLLEAKNNHMPKGLENVVIPPAIDTTKFARQKLRVWNTKPRFLTVGRLHWKKGIEYTLQALSQLEIDFSYTVIGDGPERERLIFAAHQLGISKQVQFLGKCTQQEIIKAMQEHDLFLQYSIQEGFCNAVLEAQAAGMLCIASDAEGLSENIKNNETGWIVPKRNSLLLSKKISEVIGFSMDRKAQVSDKAQKRARIMFDIKTQNEHFFNFFKQPSSAK